MTNDERERCNYLVEQSLVVCAKLPWGIRRIVDLSYFLRYAMIHQRADFREFMFRIKQFTTSPRDKGMHPPFLGKLLLCLFIAPDKQQDRLADFEESLTIVWIPQFGVRIGRLVYVWNAARSVGAIVRIGIAAAIVDRIRRAIGW